MQIFTITGGLWIFLSTLWKIVYPRFLLFKTPWKCV